MAMAVDHPRDDRATRGVDDLEVIASAEVALVVARPDPGEAPVLDERADADAEAVGATVREGRLAIEDSAHGRAMLVDGDDPIAAHAARRTDLDIVAGAGAEEGRAHGRRGADPA